MLFEKKRKLRKYWTDCTPTLVRGGVEYFDVLEQMIDSAKTTVDLQVYIFAEDETGKKVAAALYRAAERGVVVRIIVDFIGYSSFYPEFVKYAKNSNFKIRYFSPMFTLDSFYFGRRMHHKVILVDQQVALIGGLNIADKYRGVGELPWLDFAIQITGPACTEIAAICKSVWSKKYHHIPLKRPNLAVLDQAFRKRQPLVAVRDNDWGRGKNGVSRSYTYAIQHAEHSIMLVAAYFLPGAHLRRLLRQASQRGVKITVILAGTSDLGFFSFATRYLYAWLFKNNIEVYEYQKSVLHGKAAVVDDVWTTIGSYNLHYLADYNTLELNIDVLDSGFADRFKHILDKIIANDCKHISPETYPEKSSFWLRTRNYFAYQVIRHSMKLLNFFTPRNAKYEKE